MRRTAISPPQGPVQIGGSTHGHLMTMVTWAPPSQAPTRFHHHESNFEHCNVVLLPGVYKRKSRDLKKSVGLLYSYNVGSIHRCTVTVAHMRQEAAM